MSDILLVILAIAFLYWLYHWGSRRVAPRPRHSKTEDPDGLSAEQRRYRRQVLYYVAGAILVLWLVLLMILVWLGMVITDSRLVSSQITDLNGTISLS